MADDSNVYLVLDGPSATVLQRLARTPGAVPVPLNSSAQGEDDSIGGALLVGGEIFFTRVGYATAGKPAGLFAIDKMGGDPRLVVDAYSGRGLQAFGSDLFVAYIADEASVSFTTTITATLVRIPMSGGTPEVIGAPGQAPSQFEVNSSGIYWIESDRLMTMPITGGSPREVFKAPSLGPYPQIQTFLNTQFALDDGYAFLSINNLGATGSLVTELVRVPVNGGGARVLFQTSDFNDLAKVGLLGDMVYFALDAPTPAIMKVPRCGCGSN